jgi:hypothetical protein
MFGAVLSFAVIGFMVFSRKLSLEAFSKNTNSCDIKVITVPLKIIFQCLGILPCGAILLRISNFF